VIDTKLSLYKKKKPSEESEGGIEGNGERVVINRKEGASVSLTYERTRCVFGHAERCWVR